MNKVFKTCKHFEHSVNPHVHKCLNTENASLRCGYDVKEVSDCPIFGGFVDKLIHLTKEV